MPQTEIDRRVSLSLSARKQGETKKAEPYSASALFLNSCRRSGRSPALPYPPHECHECIMPSDHPFPQGTSLTLQNRGHFYFALTVFSRCFWCIFNQYR